MTPELELMERQLLWMRACIAHMQLCLELLQAVVFADRLPGEDPPQADDIEARDIECVADLARAVH